MHCLLHVVNALCDFSSRVRLLKMLSQLCVVVQSVNFLVVIEKQDQHHNSDRAARRKHILCSICGHSFGALAKDVRLFIASLYNQPMYAEMCSIDMFVKLQLVGRNLKGGLFQPPVWRLGADGGRIWAHLITRPWGPSSSYNTYIYGLSFTV